MLRWPVAGACVTIVVTIVVSMLMSRADAHAISFQPIQLRAPVELYTPFPPSAFEGSDGKSHLAYEVHITNFYRDTGIVLLEELQVLHGDTGSSLVEFDSADLDERVRHPGAEAENLHDRSIEGGMRAVVHIWVTLQAGAAHPKTLVHRLALRMADGTEQHVEGLVDVRDEPAIRIGSPLRRGIWYVSQGPGDRTGHWGGVHISNGRAIIAQRFAIDVAGLDENGIAAVGDLDRTTNEDWFGFGAEVIAVAEGIVLATRDGVSDRPPLAQMPPLSELALEAAAGNYVVLELDTDKFALYAHLQRDSLAVEVGQRVNRGDTLGRLGNSGNTNGPHLHFHISDAPGLEGEGLPFLIDSFGFLGKTTTSNVIPDWTGSEPPELALEAARRSGLPLDGDVLQFP